MIVVQRIQHFVFVVAQSKTHTNDRSQSRLIDDTAGTNINPKRKRRKKKKKKEAKNQVKSFYNVGKDDINIQILARWDDLPSPSSPSPSSPQ